MKRNRVLILAGAREARLLTDRLSARPNIDAIVSLAGATDHPHPYSAPVRTGGFGGIAGLRRFLQMEAIDLLVNATHPFAEQISRSAEIAARLAGVPLLRLTRKPWEAASQDRWFHAKNLMDAIAKIPEGERAFFATGSGSVETIYEAAVQRPETDFLVRVIDVRERRSLGNFQIVSASPPFSLEDELNTLSSFGATYLVTKNSGGSPGATKLSAACELKIPVIMIARQYTGRAEHQVVYSVEDGLRWIEKML
ncbi:MAG: precorrin-6A/cobalt-precorrin-6A reductase [Hyphomicrobiales bacterium]|nr:precorrin-6A/cobalt-precorrin-6A reductase [Hyphomicrobiales bacterium]